MYESFLKTIFNPIEVKFADAIIDFLNIVKPECNWSYKKFDDDIWIYADSHKFAFKIVKSEHKLFYYINCDHHYNQNYSIIGVQVMEFLLHLFNKDYMSILDITVSSNEIKDAIKKLTKENFDDFSIKYTANKFNL